MKRLAILAVMLTIALPIYGQEKSFKTDSYQERSEDIKTHDAQRSPSVPSTQINVINKEASNAQKDGTKDHSNSYFKRLFAPENIPNIGLFFAGVIGIMVAVYTLKEIERSTKATEKSVELQEVLNQQWLEFENWKIMDGGTDAEIGTVILISFDIVNPTKMPLTISGYSVSVKGQDTSVQFGRTIAPAKSYSVKLDRLLEGKESEDYIAGKLILPLTCSVPYIDAFTKPQQARSDFCFLCGPHGFQPYNHYRG
jgi:hypothetical protein